MTVPTRVTITKLNDDFVEVVGLAKQIRQADGTLQKTYLNAASVTATLKDSTGTPVTGFNGITLVYVAGSNGIYGGQIQETFSPAVGGSYTLHIDASEGGLVMHLEIATTVSVRRS